VWVEPVVVAEIEFLRWTHEDTVRAASFKGLRDDKDPREVVRESA
jgi:bifunctional non-homologous end joining protein LigD